MAYVCGLYYTLPDSRNWSLVRNYLPQVDTQAHTTILSNTSRTTLTQTFLNPSDIQGIKEARYAFPLYEGVSVVGFTCHVGDQVIVGEVKEKEKAREAFREAVERGETAGLLEQLPTASDVFTTTVGNIAPRAKIVVEITYLGELKHDSEVDGIRFTIPRVICPRYGDYPGELKKTDATEAEQKGISITVDVEMADGSLIQQIRSPSHPVSVSIGTTSVAPGAEPSMTKASATLSLQNPQWDKDFILQVICKDIGIPKAVLETHSGIPHQRALMATLVPKFSLPPERPEIVFICDRSGSMGGSRIDLAIKALHLFLKSLPLGVTFNICSFGSTHSFLWPKSRVYSQSALQEAVAHVSSFSANFGGTEMLAPIMKTLQNRHRDTSLAVMLLTDGEIWSQQALFDYLNGEIIEARNPIRVFTLGVGNGVSHALIEGIAKSGNGFSQAVGEGEKMDSKVIRMLKGGLVPLVDDYTIEVNYETQDDFELVERVIDSMNVKLRFPEEKETKLPKTTSLFDPSVDLDQEIENESPNDDLPVASPPKIIQSPNRIPQLYSWNRTTVYLLLGPEAPHETPKSVTLRGTSKHGPLELEIPIQVLEEPGDHIHKLAAKKAIAELEQGRGWLTEAKDETGNLLKEVFESRFEGMVEREAVRLGVQFQVASKWTPFVAVQKKEEKEDEQMFDDFEWIDEKSIARKKIDDIATRGDGLYSLQDKTTRLASQAAVFASVAPGHRPTTGGKAARKAAPALEESIDFSDEDMDLVEFDNDACMPLPDEEEDEDEDEDDLYDDVKVVTNHERSEPPAPQAQFASFGDGGAAYGSNARFSAVTPATAFGSTNAAGAGLVGAASPFGQTNAVTGGLFGSAQQSVASPFGNTNAATGGLFGSAQQSAASPMMQMQMQMQSRPVLPESEFPLMRFAGGPGQRSALQGLKENLNDDQILNVLVSLQTFEGFWEWNTSLLNALPVNQKEAENMANELRDMRVAATALAVAFLEDKCEHKKDEWELLVEKARGWLEGRLGGADGASKVVEKVTGLLRVLHVED
jgi:hypothetical protein